MKELRYELLNFEILLSNPFPASISGILMAYVVVDLNFPYLGCNLSRRARGNPARNLVVLHLRSCH